MQTASCVFTLCFSWWLKNGPAVSFRVLSLQWLWGSGGSVLASVHVKVTGVWWIPRGQRQVLSLWLKSRHHGSQLGFWSKSVYSQKDVNNTVKKKSEGKRNCFDCRGWTSVSYTINYICQLHVNLLVCLQIIPVPQLQVQASFQGTVSKLWLPPDFITQSKKCKLCQWEPISTILLSFFYSLSTTWLGLGCTRQLFKERCPDQWNMPRTPQLGGAQEATWATSKGSFRCGAVLTPDWLSSSVYL